MTLAIGVASPEGSVLVTDSLTSVFDGARWRGEYRTDDKLFIWPASGMAFIYSGLHPCEWQVKDPGPRGNFQLAARELLQALASLSAPPAALVESVRCEARRPDGSVPDETELGLTDADLLVANLRDEAPSIGLVSTRKSPERWIGPEGGVLVAGAAFEWWQGQDQPKPLATLDEARRVALEIAERFHRHQYGSYTFAQRQADLRRNGSAAMPSSAPPYVGLSIEPKRPRVRRWLVEVDADDRFGEPQPLDIPRTAAQDVIGARLRAWGMTAAEFMELAEQAKGDPAAEREFAALAANLAGTL